MDCLQDFIGLKGCSATPPASGIYLNDLAGMSNELLQKISSPDQDSYIETFRAIERVAHERLKTDMYTLLFSAGDVQMIPVLHKSRGIQILNRQEVQVRPASEQYRGAYVQVSGSRYLSVYVEAILVYCHNEPTEGSSGQIETTLRIFQTQDGLELYSMPISLSKGMNKIVVNQELFPDFDALNLFFAVDCTEVDTLQNVFIWEGWGYGLDACAAWAYPFWQINGWLMYPATSDLDYIAGVPHQTGRQSGVWPLLEIRCSMESLICRYKDRLKLAIAYSEAAQVCQTKLATYQQNHIAQSKIDETKELMKGYMDDYISELKAVCRGIDLKGEGYCFSCQQSRLVAVRGLKA